MPEARTCPNCGSAVPIRSPESLCPRCMLMAGMGDDSVSPLPEDRPDRDAQAAPAQGVLETIGATVGALPCVILRDTACGGQPVPIIRPASGNGNDTSTRYRIDGEIARGGMGSVLKGRDPDLGREVAIKVLREDHRNNDHLIRRFVEEAQIGGQLQHPGVVPIYELGTFADHRPFFSMKLVQGQTLAEVLAARSAAADDRPRFLSIFAAVAQTMAYAHTRSVIHRDLKPSNVMVGSFGEVQVMDWGLAKVLPRGGVVDDAKAGQEKPPEARIATARTGADTDLSHAGSIMGTPSYMAPEQARGETDRIDERADVFALGSILGELLTGTPAFTGDTSVEVVRRAARGDTADALARLESCGAEAELVTLAKDCLAVEPEDRPRDAGLVAGRITAYLAGVQERVQAAERERAVAVAKAIEERRRRKVQLALAASLLAFTMLGGLSTTYYLQQRAERTRLRAEKVAAVDRVVGQAVTLRDQARTNPDDVARWQVALAAVQQAEAARDPDARPRLLALHAEIQAGLDTAERDKALLDRLVDIRSAKGDDPDGSATDAAYTDAFREARIDFVVLTPAEAGARIKGRPASVVLGLAAALDDWAGIRRVRRADAAGATRLTATARDADPDPWRNALRTTLDQSDTAVRLAGLQALARTAKYDELGPISLHLLGTGLDAAGDSSGAEPVLRAAQERHPRDVWVNHALGMVLAKRSRRDEAMGKALQAQARSDEAGEVLEAAEAAGRAATRLRSDDALAHFNLGNALKAQGKVDLAIAEFHAVIRLKPDDAGAHYNLGNALRAQGKVDLAIAELRAAIRLRPDYAEAHANLGNALQAQGDYAGALEMYRKGHELGSKRPNWRYPSAQWVKAAERDLARWNRLLAIVRGEEKINDNAERLTFARLAHDHKNFAGAARLWSEALENDPKLAEDRQAGHRYNAACAASLAAAGQGKDDPPPDDAAKAKLRGQALDWLKAELASWTTLLESGPPERRPDIIQTLQNWKRDANLAVIRDASALARLPEAERKEWQGLWADVEALLKPVQARPATTVPTPGREPAEAPEPAPTPTGAADSTARGS